MQVTKSFCGRLTVKEEEKGKETENDEESSDNSLFNPFHPDVSLLNASRRSDSQRNNSQMNDSEINVSQMTLVFQGYKACHMILQM